MKLLATTPEIAASRHLGRRGYWLVTNDLIRWEVRWVTDDDTERMEWNLVGHWTYSIVELEARLAELNWPTEETTL
jgi:hypothetical protein